MYFGVHVPIVMDNIVQSTYGIIANIFSFFSGIFSVIKQPSIHNRAETNPFPFFPCPCVYFAGRPDPLSILPHYCSKPRNIPHSLVVVLG